MFANIALYIDPEVDNQPMLDCISPIAKSQKAKVTLFSTVKPLPDLFSSAIQADLLASIQQDMQGDAQKAVDQAAQRLKNSGLQVTTRVAVGEAFVEAIRLVLSNKIDLLAIMSANAQQRLAANFFGSTQMHLLRKCPCPVWIVKAETQPLIKNILTPIDVSSEQPSAISLNVDLVLATKAIESVSHANVRLLNIWSVYGEGYMSTRGGLSEDSIEKMRSQTYELHKQRLASYADEVNWSHSQFNMELINSSLASTQIITKVQEHNIDLLIMGSVCRTGIAGFLIGNTAEKVLTEVSCSVLAFKPTEFVSPVTLSDTSM